MFEQVDIFEIDLVEKSVRDIVLLYDRQFCLHMKQRVVVRVENIDEMYIVSLQKEQKKVFMSILLNVVLM